MNLVNHEVTTDAKEKSISESVVALLNNFIVKEPNYSKSHHWAWKKHYAPKHHLCPVRTGTEQRRSLWSKLTQIPLGVAETT